MARQKKLTLEELFAKASTLGLPPESTTRPRMREDGTPVSALEAAWASTRVMIALGTVPPVGGDSRRFLSMDIAEYVMDNLMGSLNSSDAYMVRERLGKGQEWYQG